ncbi:MAG: peptidoglycan-binding domain-containing protein [Cyanobacteria bacterium P01_G01_bin.54]
MHYLLPLQPQLLTAGDRGGAVAHLQAALKEIRYYTHEITGEFDPRTTHAVCILQCRYGLEITGQFDLETWYALTFWVKEDEQQRSAFKGLIFNAEVPTRRSL